MDDEQHGCDERGWVVEELIQFRWGMCLLADYIVNLLDLPMPGNEICILWDRLSVKQSLNKKHPGWDNRKTKVWHALLDGGFCQKYSGVVGVGETLVPPILEFSHSCRVDFNSSPELSVMVATPG